MAVSRDVARVNFGRFVRRALDAAHERGLTDDDIAKAAKVGDSTFHRWAKGDWERAPQLQKVLDFCIGLNLPPEEALRALGIRGDNTPPVAEPQIDADVAAVIRKLRDPNVSEAEKQAIRHTLRLLGHAPTR